MDVERATHVGVQVVPGVSRDRISVFGAGTPVPCRSQLCEAHFIDPLVPKIDVAYVFATPHQEIARVIPRCMAAKIVADPLIEVRPHGRIEVLVARMDGRLCGC
jgi:hypothetical protein